MKIPDRISKSIEEKSSLVATWGWEVGEQEWGIIANKYVVYWGRANESVLNLYCKYTLRIY